MLAFPGGCTFSKALLTIDEPTRETHPVMGYKYSLLLCGVLTMAGCAAMLERSSDNPAEKLKWASELLSKEDDTAEAEKLIREAIAIYGKKKYQHGLAEAYRQSGLFFRSNAVNEDEAYYRENPFLDPTVKYKDRYEKAIEYFNRSKELFADYGHLDVVSNIYIGLGKTYDITNRREEACDAFYKSLESFALFKLNEPEVQENRPDEIRNYMENVESMREQAGCGDLPVSPTKSVLPDPREAPLSPYAPQERPVPQEPSGEPSQQ